MTKAIIGYSELVIKVDKDKYFKCQPTGTNLVLDPKSIHKGIQVKVEAENNFQKFQGYFLGGLIKKIQEITVTAVDQTHLTHTFVFSSPQIVFIKKDVFSFNYSTVDLNSDGYAKTSYRKVDKPIFIDSSKPISVSEPTEFLESKLNLQDLSERTEKQTKKKPQTSAQLVKGEYLYDSLDGLDIFSPGKLALQVIWSDVSIESIEKQLANRDENYYTRFINRLNSEYAILKRKNKKLKLKNNVVKFFKIGFYLLTQPIGKQK